MAKRGNTAQGSDRSIATATDPIHHNTIAPRPEVVRQDSGGTTHDVHGGGNPRLIATFDDSIDLNASLGDCAVPRVFQLHAGTTSIGSDPDCDIALPGIEAHQAEVRRDELDEYRIFDLSSDHSSRIDGRYDAGQSMHSGDRLTFGRWTFVYARAQFADHGSPYGGHVGGLPYGSRSAQPTPRPRGTSAGGGADPAPPDPGEYY